MSEFKRACSLLPPESNNSCAEKARLGTSGMVDAIVEDVSEPSMSA